MFFLSYYTAKMTSILNKVNRKKFHVKVLISMLLSISNLCYFWSLLQPIAVSINCRPSAHIATFIAPIISFIANKPALSLQLRSYVLRPGNRCMYGTDSLYVWNRYTQTHGTYMQMTGTEKGGSENFCTETCGEHG